jgi:class 3 adenylate cyclase
MAMQERALRSVATENEMPPHLSHWAEQLERSRWPGWVLDEKFVLRYASTELRLFMARSLGREVDDDSIGIGRPLMEALLSEAWTATMSPDSLMALMPRAMEYVKGEFQFTEEEARELVPEAFWPFYEAAEDKRPYGVLSDRFMYTVPGLPDAPVEFLLFGIRDREGRFMGAGCVSQMGLRPTLVSLLSLGDEDMYQRMANLQEPRRCQGAILFADLEGSSKLSRTLSTSTYFRFIRSMATAIDAAVASNGGVVGKHAGDGASGFFLISDGEDASEMARGAMVAARAIRAKAREVIEELCNGTAVDPAGLGMNIGLHWGASLFVGQLVPGGRLDITALGDSVNECARIQEAARGGELLASKHFLEHLSGNDVTDANLDLDTVTYTTVAEIDGVSEKAARDAGSIPVTRIS